jgi:hypothetical protein
MLKSEMESVPDINKVYNFFEDGKLRRNDRVEVTGVLTFDEIDDKTKEIWKEELDTFKMLYSDKTDFFIQGTLLSNNIKLVFARTIDGGWFSFTNYVWDGRLDVDGKMMD